MQQKKNPLEGINFDVFKGDWWKNPTAIYEMVKIFSPSDQANPYTDIMQEYSRRLIRQDELLNPYFEAVQRYTQPEVMSALAQYKRALGFK